jgi:hypothetical protein
VFSYLVFFLGLLGSAVLVARREYYLPSLILVPLVFFLFTGSGHRPGDPYGMDVYYSGAFLPFAMIATCAAGSLLERLGRRRGGKRGYDLRPARLSP